MSFCKNHDEKASPTEGFSIVSSLVFSLQESVDHKTLFEQPFIYRTACF